MPRPKSPPNRIVGIEDRGGEGPNRFRLRFVDGGEPDSRGFADRAAAEAFKEVLERAWRKRGGLPVGSAIDAWLADRQAQNMTVYPYHRRWVPELLEDLLDEPVTALSADDLEARYKALADTKAGATSSLILTCLKQFCAFLQAAKHTSTNLAADIERRGVIKAGKAQIETKRELHAFRDELWRRAWEGDLVCVGILVSLYCGLRPGEVQGLQGRHVDEDRALVVPGTKNENARRVLTIEHDDLWSLLEATAERVGMGGHICQFTTRTVIDRIRSVAKAAGVTNADELVWQSMRGQAASIARANGAALRAIADGLGQASVGVTRKHYVSKVAEAAGDQRARLGVLQGGKR